MDQLLSPPLPDGHDDGGGRAEPGQGMSPSRPTRPAPLLPRGRTESTVLVLYVGLLGLLLIEQFVLRAPPRAYLDVALLFAVATVVLAVGRARTALRTGRTPASAALSVLPVALVGAAVGIMIIVKSGAEPSATGVAGGGLVFLLGFVGVTVGSQLALDRRRDDPSGQD